MHSFRATILPGPNLLTPPFVSGAQQGLKNGLESRTIAETFSGNPSVSISERLWAFQHQWQGRGVYVGSFDESVNANLSRYCGCQWFDLTMGYIVRAVWTKQHNHWWKLVRYRPLKLYSPAIFLSIANSSLPLALQSAWNFELESVSKDEGLWELVTKYGGLIDEIPIAHLSNSIIRPSSNTMT